MVEVFIKDGMRVFGFIKYLEFVGSLLEGARGVDKFS